MVIGVRGWAGGSGVREGGSAWGGRPEGKEQMQHQSSYSKVPGDQLLWPRDRFPVGVESERMPQGERKSVLSLVLPHMNRGRACVVAAL